MTSAATPEPAPRRKSRLRWWLLGALVVLVLLVVAALYLGYLGLKAKDSLDSARGHASSAQRAFLAGDTDKAVDEANAAVTDAASAKDDAHNPVWSAAAAIPWLGDPLQSVQEMTDSVDALASDVLAPTAELAGVINPDNLRAEDNTINTTALSEAQPQLAVIADRAEEIQADVTSTDGSWFGTVSDARTQLLDQLTESARFIRGTDTAAQLLPPMLGAGGERNYFFGFQTPAESRPTGGLLGAYGVVSAENGRVDVDDLGTNAEIDAPPNPVDLGEEYDYNYKYSRPYTDIRNSNISAHFPYAAQIWMSMWEQQSGTKLDGAVALDPIALSYLLDATGPVTLANGQKVSGDDVTELTLSTSYQQFANNNTARKAYLQEIAQKSVSALTSMRGNTSKVLEALGRSVHEQRLMVYSADEREQQLLADAGLAHDVAETAAPYANVVVGNLAGNKIDYYLERAITYSAGSCDSDTRTSTVEVKFTNTLTDLNLPPYVIGSLGNPQLQLPNGTNFSAVTLYGTQGATIDSATIDGESMLIAVGTERGHPFATGQIQIPPGETVTVTYQLTEPTSPGEPVVPVQPLVDDPEVKVDVPVCG
ncbi:uncharacterized protein DUF4012 [Williamsia limnetica]|uniref:Uncharacterized protein DUF4012 n=1 Tax=Williamsia limnetica TaxID=882452 RepID=A0A318RNK1_WILLI|nr:DUF4012 domain-containing protein [Williamsia limnetica]PYE20205.1 uncharacterized protein DUF4012 [Williamsia limnetica]